MKRDRLLLGTFFWLLLAFIQASGQESISAKIDAIVEAPVKAGRVAGGSVAVLKGNETIVMKGYGFADLELDVPTPPRATYEIGSITKQFTAAGILLLAEQGKLSLADEMTKFLPDYPTRGNHVTIRHLLNHTSGIKGYTELREFRDFQMLKNPREELVKLFSGKPFDFNPGDEQIYNNSAFFLLGLIIERVAGQTYAEFIQEHLFNRVGMTDSYYCSERAIHKNHAHGYDTVRDVLALKAYLDHSWLYAAGSLCSSATDLVAWNKALHGGKVLKPESYREMTSPALLNGGAAVRYGMGISLTETDARRTISHGGRINGFLSESEYYPDDDLVIVVLLNTTGPVTPRDLARQIAAAVLGKAPDRRRPFEGDLTPFAGDFTGKGRGRPTTIHIGVSGNQILFTNTEIPRASAQTLEYFGNDTFGFKDTVVMFERENGKIPRLHFDTGYGHNILSRQSTSEK